MRLLLLHIPKTGGASLRAAALRHYPKRQNIHVRPAYGRDGHSKNEREWLNHHTTRHERQRSRLITGHYRWGIHKYLPGDSEYAVCLRAPDERIVSMYRWLRESRSERSRNWAAGGFDAFLSSRLADIENGATRILAGCDDVADERSKREMTVADYELAAERLAECSVVGIFDDLQGFVRRIAVRHHWGDVGVALPKVHVSTTKRPRISPGASATIASLNEFDWLLYEQAVRCADVSV